MPRQSLNPPSLFNSQQYGFSQITISQGSRIVNISGQVAWDAQGRIIGPGDLRQQTFQAFENLKIAIEVAGGTLDDIAALRFYIVQSVIAESAPVREGLLHFFPHNPPASTWIGVPALANAEFLIEIEAFAVLD